MVAPQTRYAILIKDKDHKRRMHLIVWCTFDALMVTVETLRAGENVERVDWERCGLQER